MNKLNRFIEEHKEQFQFIGKVDNKIIENAEKNLSMNLPEILKEIIKNYGALSFKHVEFYGLGVKDTSHLNIVKRTVELRGKKGFPEKAIVIEDIGDGHYAITNENGEVYEWISVNRMNPLVKIEDDLESYLLRRFREVLDV